MQIRKFRPDIEVLRAIAVLAVVISHSKITLESGFIGVDIFFVISGFLITKHLHDEVQKTGSVSMGGFYARRILRILPASVFVVLMTILAFLIWLSPLQTINYGWDSFVASLSGMNYRLAVTGTDYFNSTSLPTPFQHFWSLAVEEQFYVIWPLLIIIIAKIFIRKPKTLVNSTDLKYIDFESENKRVQAFEKEFAAVYFLKFKIAITLLLILIIATSLYLSYSVTLQSQPWAYFGLQTRAWQLAIGSLLAFYVSTFAKINHKVAAILSWLGFAGLILGFVWISEKTVYPGLWSLIPTLSTALIVLSGVNETKYSFENLFNCRPVRWIGKISYSWYLVHWPLFVMFFYTVGDGLSAVHKFALILVSFVLANLCFLLVENPIRFATWVRVSLVRTFALGLLLILISAGASYSVVYIKTESLKNYEEVEVVQNVLDEKALTQRIKQGLASKKIPFELKTPLSMVPTDRPYLNCYVPQSDIELPEIDKCTIKNPKNTKTIALIGDSHIYQWANAFQKIAEKYNYNLLTLVKPGCPMYEVSVFDPTLNRDYSECYIWRKNMLKKLAEIKPDIVIHSGIIYKEANVEKFIDYMKTLKSITSNVVNIVDTRKPNIQIPECLTKNSDDIQKCTFNTDFELNNGGDIKEQQTKVAKELGVQNIETTGWFCFEKLCPPIVQNIVVYQDDNHVSNTYAQYLGGLLEQKLITAIPEINQTQK
jgi:peptidoglycan/LPS O-acetylase OafA/YrhL